VRKNYIAILWVATFPLAFATGASAQSTAPAVPAAPSAATQYELSSTQISGASSTTPPIYTAPIPSDAGAYKTQSGIYLYPTATVGAGRNSNVGASRTNAVSSNLTRFETQLITEIKNKGDRYTALASVGTTRYASSEQDNKTGSEIKVAGDNYFTSRARAGWSLGQLNDSDPRGAGLRTSVNKFHVNDIKTRLIYGAPEASGRLELDLGHLSKTYDSNRFITQFLDYSQLAVTGRAYYRLGSRSMALAEMTNNRSDYASDQASAANNTERRYYAGLTWDATAATTGIIKVGQTTKDFSQGNTPGFSGFSWDATVQWSPLTYSVFNLQTGKSTANSSGTGNFELRTNNNLSWNHRWSSVFNTRAALGSSTTEYVGANRKDTTLNYGIGMGYDLSRWLNLGVDLAATDNSSNQAIAEYKKNILMVTLNASL
jgi:hypothetical protein